MAIDQPCHVGGYPALGVLTAGGYWRLSSQRETSLDSTQAATQQPRHRTTCKKAGVPAKASAAQKLQINNLDSHYTFDSLQQDKHSRRSLNSTQAATQQPRQQTACNNLLIARHLLRKVQEQDQVCGRVQAAMQQLDDTWTPPPVAVQALLRNGPRPAASGPFSRWWPATSRKENGMQRCLALQILPARRSGHGQGGKRTKIQIKIKNPNYKI